MKQQALGLIETRGLVAAIEGADAAVKAAAVELLGYEKVKGGLVMIAVTGEVAAVQAAVSAGSAAAGRVGHVISQHIIPRPLADIQLLISRGKQGPDEGPDGGPDGPSGRPKGGSAFGPRPSPAGGPNSGQADGRADNPLASLAHAKTGKGTPAGPPVEEKSARGPAEPEDLQKLSVHELRRLARKTRGIAIYGRQISRANKEQLIAEILQAQERG